MTAHDHELLASIADVQDRSLSAAVRIAIAEFLDRNKPEEPALPLAMDRPRREVK